ncbi:sulfite exporter TauE/SafE family protein [Cohaesibacter celericrescens]|uniref:Probable membrane transporter protein n=3 Tax=Cohaesibacter celericrescens TaxID=2067669 RepID=A0A2N5XK57_9HYPH|nr:sulfite exporter TauE/SafE family protein [Cohaesibacter celericrescens]PLW74875.1 permease [Cohaesibacter celericrescens]
MELYLPIAELPVNVFVILSMGGAVGFISGIFGVGGGFLLTPLLIFYGISPAVAVASVTAQITASSTTGSLAYLRTGNLDLKLGTVLFSAGIVGSVLGVEVFAILRQLGQLDLIISISYVTFLGAVGSLMVMESVRAIVRTRKGTPISMRKPGQHNWVHGLPFKMRFKKSKLYVSVLPVIFIGGTIGFLGTVLGIGGGFMLVPALIYLLRVPTAVVIGTSLFQIVVTMAVATVLHASTNQTVDIVLALILMIGGTIGAQFGAQIGQKLKAEQLRALLGLLVLMVGVRFAVDLIIEPQEPYSIEVRAEK